MSCHLNLPDVELGSLRYFYQCAACVLLAFGLFTALHAQTTNPPLSLSTAVTQTLDENPALKIFPIRQQVLDGRRSTADLAPGFQLGFEVEDFAATVDEDDFEGTKLTLTLSSVIEMGDKREARVGVVDSRYQQMDAKREVEALDLLGEVTRRYIAALTAQYQLALAREAAQLAEQARIEIKLQSEAGIVPMADLKRAEAASAQARLLVATKEGQFTYLKTALAAMWGSNTPAFEALDGDLYQLGDMLEFETLFAKVGQNPAIQVYAAEERMREAEQRLAGSSSSTDLRWTVGVKRFYDLKDTAFTAGISMPLFTSRRNEGARSAASAARDAVAVNREVTLLNIRTQLFHAYTQRAQAMLTVEQLRAFILPALDAALKETQQAYQQGNYRYLDYLSARQEWLAARGDLIDAASAALTSGAEIEQLTAEPLMAVNATTDTTGLSQ